MKLIRRFFFSQTTATVSSMTSLVLIAGILIISGVAHQGTAFGSFILILQFIQVTGLFSLYRKHDLIQMSAATAGLLFTILLNQAHEVLNTLLIEKLTFYQRLGLSGCSYIALNSTVLFLQCLIVYNHFGLNRYQINGRVKLAVNQLSLVVQTVLFLLIAFVSFLLSFSFHAQLVQTAAFVKDTFLLILVGCCELILALDRLE